MKVNKLYPDYGGDAENCCCVYFGYFSLKREKMWKALFFFMLTVSRKTLMEYYGICGIL